MHNTTVTERNGFYEFFISHKMDVLDEILDLIESVSEYFPTYSLS